MALTTVRAGFIPLVDCAALVVAKEKGFARHHGLDLHLSREGAWAAIRDKVAYGVLDCAHMLAAMPLAMHLGLQGVQVAMAVPMALGQGGNAITLAPWLVAEMNSIAPSIMAGPRNRFNQALGRVIAVRQQRNEPALKLASVYPFSSHNYELRQWLVTAGIDPERDVELVVVPPPRMVESLQRGDICGYCVGEPWNQQAICQGLGILVATKREIQPDSPEKVLGMRAQWLQENPDTARQLVLALMQAGRWADDPANRVELASLLSLEDYVGVDAALLQAVLAGCPWVAAGVVENIPGYQRFFANQAQRPTLSQGAWLLEQMALWGQVEREREPMALAAEVFLPDYYDKVAALV